MAEKDMLPANISIDWFQGCLDHYGSLVQSISSDKIVKPDQKSLVELDEFRYEVAVEAFRSDKPKRHMTHDDVKTLVDWKLRHGKFRPTLMKLVSSNDGDIVKKTIQQAIAEYWADQDVARAMSAIAKLKGVGPATASLLLSVHDPHRVIFFSDEAFWWLCCSGQKSPIKYNAKEYQQLSEAADKVAKRLQVSATDIEKVAYVIMKDGHSQFTPSISKSQAAPSREKEEAADEDLPKKARKRGNSSVIDTSQKPTRRSKRHKAS
ncbi:hypothetical protein F5Y19DRAFT_101760 [Xylariaceae sp. FL1651]|nr:hypothetical protein F5Y19DRAFT_101760 [Xylariaceae sp. FL1651]